MVHFASYTDLVDPLEEPQFELPLPQGSPASLEAGALGARHVDSDLPGSCEGSGGIAEPKIRQKVQTQWDLT